MKTFGQHVHSTEPHRLHVHVFVAHEIDTIVTRYKIQRQTSIGEGRVHIVTQSPYCWFGANREVKLLEFRIIGVSVSFDPHTCRNLESWSQRQTRIRNVGTANVNG